MKKVEAESLGKDICKSRYRNASLGAIARNMTIEDIESRMNAAGIAARNANKGYNNQSIQYGTTKTVKGSYAQYPAIYAQEKYSGVNISDVTDGAQIILGEVNETALGKMNPKGKKQSEDVYMDPTTDTYKTDATTLTCTQTYYNFDNTPSSYFDDSNFYNMIFETGTDFWLASRYVSWYSSDSYANFGLRYVRGRNLGGNYLFYSNDDYYIYHYRLAPLVSLGSGVQIKSGEGTKEKPYVIGK